MKYHLIHNTSIIIRPGTYVIPTPTSTIVAKADTGASQHYFRNQDTAALENLQPVSFGPVVNLPDSTSIQAQKQGNVLLHPSLSHNATTSHVFNHLTNASLLSIGQLCDDDCIATFQKKLLHIYKNRICILTGTRNGQDGLWDISLPVSESTNVNTSLPCQSMNVIIRKEQSKSDLAAYLYACCGSPPVSSFLKAARNGNLITWSGIFPPRNTFPPVLHLPRDISIRNRQSFNLPKQIRLSILLMYEHMSLQQQLFLLPPLEKHFKI